MYPKLLEFANSNWYAKLKLNYFRFMLRIEFRILLPMSELEYNAIPLAELKRNEIGERFGNYSLEKILETTESLSPLQVKWITYTFLGCSE